MHLISTILSLALVLVAPGLCKGGVLVHPCDDEHSNSTDHDNHHEKDGGCGHEDGCAQDPCSLALRTTPTNRVSAALHGDGFDATPAACLFDAVRLPLPDLDAPTADGSPPARLASAQPDRCLPLLI